MSQSKVLKHGGEKLFGCAGRLCYLDCKVVEESDDQKGACEIVVRNEGLAYLKFA
jgi:hypothetical protein